MSSKRGKWLLPVALVTGGVTVGVMAGFLSSRGWTAQWVETAGTWVGAVGTIVTLIWAVHVFRADRDRSALAHEQSLRSNAARVGVTVASSSGTPDGDGFLVDYTKVLIVNDSSSPIRVQRFGFPAVSAAPRLPILISPGQSDEQYVEFPSIYLTSEEFNRQDGAVLAWFMEFESDGVWWRRDEPGGLRQL